MEMSYRVTFGRHCKQWLDIHKWSTKDKSCILLHVIFLSLTYAYMSYVKNWSKL